MAFLDNSGDIILDAVLTDTGRKRLAKGDGSFQIVKFALADDEIDYSLYQNANHTDGAHASGTAYYDLNIMMTPIFEAFTNNTATMKSKLISLPRTNLLYMPVVKLNETANLNKVNATVTTHVITVDTITATQWAAETEGVMNGAAPSAETTAPSSIRVDQGLDTTQIARTQTIDSDLKETQYIIEMDNRLGQLIDREGTAAYSVSYIDDDEVASYYVSLGIDATVRPSQQAVANAANTYAVDGPRGTVLEFRIASSTRLSSSDHLFDTLGSVTTQVAEQVSSEHYKYIDTNIRITGATTGASIDIPVRYVKKV